MRVQFRNPFPLLIKFKTLINNNNPNSSLQSHRFFPHLRFFSSSSSSSGPVNCKSSNTDIVVVTNPMATANPKPPSLPSSSSTAEIDNTVGIAAKCWSKYKPFYDLCLYTPFVIALAAGNLNRNSFRHYIAQDIFFLRAFVKLFNMAEEYADDDDAKAAIAVLRDSVRKESEMHDAFVEWCKLEWGIDITEDEVPHPATTNYTDFLEDTAKGKYEGSKTIGMFMTPYEKTKAAAYAVGALTPCVRLYSYMGKELLAILGNNISSHLYRKWIDNYSSNAFQETALQTEQLLDKLTVTLTGEELDITEKLYYQALKLELEFFLAQPLAQKLVVPLSTELKETGVHLVLFSDFDLTCTKIDSSSILATVAIMTAPKTYDEQPEQLGQLTSADMQETWDTLSKQYTEEFEQYVGNTLLVEKADKFDYNRLHQALKEVSEFEKSANTRVIRSGVLKGLNIEAIRKAGERMQFEDGCTNFFSSILNAQNLSVDIFILSYCWCEELIKSSLSSADLGALKIRANKLVLENSSTTGDIERDVESPHDKVRSFIKILQQVGNDGERLTVYIGDSLGDLLCLVKADIGIVIGRSESLRRVGEHFGISFVPLYAGLVRKQIDSSPWRGRHSGTLYTVSTWAEIHLFFFGNNPFKSDKEKL